MMETTTHESRRKPPWLARAAYTLGDVDGDGHEATTHRWIAARVAALLEFPYGGAWPAVAPVTPSYLIPRATLSGREQAAAFAVAAEDDLFGGWVPSSWMATKAIMHPLVSRDAEAPADWTAGLAREGMSLALRGHTAFSAPDALAAGRRLTDSGPVRVKPANADGGRGQVVARTGAELERAVASLCEGGRLTDILTLEEQLDRIETFSVGQARLPGRTISYCGTQSATVNNDGESAYGGSTLFLVRGGFDRLLARDLPPDMRAAIARAIAFDRLADSHIPGLIASRRNYDVAIGVGADGARRAGVLEQSWRVGGATAAEILALEAFARDPGIAVVHARTVEVYGEAAGLPQGAVVYYQGHDPVAGPLTKYACVERTIEGQCA